MTRTPLVLLWGVPREPPLAAVHRALLAAGARTVMIDQRRALSSRLGHPATGPVLTLRAGAPLPLSDVTAAYPRPYPALPVIADDRAARAVALRHVARLEYELWQWLATTTATVVNRPAAAASNDAKPVQTRVADGCGFLVPETLLTTDPRAAVEFAARHGPVIYKGISGTRTRPGLFDPADGARLGRLPHCPTLFQRRIAGTNVRVHVIGAEVYATEVTTTAVDYREQVTRMRQAMLPADIAERCRAVTKALGLLAAGLDLIRSQQGDWYFLEANPSPAFTFYPDGDRVAAAFARLLTRNPRA